MGFKMCWVVKKLHEVELGPHQLVKGIMRAREIIQITKLFISSIPSQLEEARRALE